MLNGDEGLSAAQILATDYTTSKGSELLLTTLLSAASSRMGAARIVIQASANYTQPAIFRTMLVLPPGCTTPAQKVIIHPLEQLEHEDHSRWQEQMRQYKRDMAHWNRAAKKGQNAGEYPTPPPDPQRYVVSDATIVATVRIHEKNPRGFLVCDKQDSADLSERKKYRNGFGEESELLRSEFDGGPLMKDTIKESLYVSKACISRTGSIQWPALKKMMAKGNHLTGEWARWLFCVADAPPSYLKQLGEGGKDSGLSDTLRRLYRGLEKIEPADYLLSDEAEVLFDDKQHELVDMYLLEDNEGLKIAYPKFEGYLARFALWLHLVNAVLANVTPAPAVSGETMLGAIRLVDYYIGQLRLIYAQNDL
ncbi:MAG: DUF3987 domain-containing protein [Oscillatoria princeps RMCB-10]|jgi:hypothetical protein|nr:DUF3987 domain-containing protein [Oscillatoria princeps RMCB-10]